jgi:hypothetical protein
MDKRGSHVGMMISFAIFIVFLIFLYSIMEPAIKTQSDKKALLEYLKNDLVTNLSYDITTSYINITGATTNNCANLLGITEGIGIKPGLSSYVVVKDGSDNVLVTSPSSSDLKVQRVFRSDRILKVFHSYGLNESSSVALSPCDDLVQSVGYDFAFIRTRTYVFKERLIDLVNMYESDYNGVKLGFNVPVGSDFGFSFTESDGNVISTPEENVSKSVYVDEFPVEYVDDEANVLPGFISVRVW